MSFESVLFVGFGGFIGSVFRYILASSIKSINFPYATLTANFLGCFIIGFLMYYFSKNPNNSLKLFFVTGLMGGLTTFSTFSFETVNLIKNQEVIKAFTNILISLIGCLLLTTIGYKIGQILISKSN